MQSLMTAAPPIALRSTVAVLMALTSYLALAPSAGAALASGVYQTAPGTTVQEYGDALHRGSRIVPFSATVTFDLEATPPSLTAFIANAVLEGSDPFPLTVRSSDGGKLSDGTYLFRGDYLGEVQNSGSQYAFEWRFSTSPDARVVWNGINDWTGGHIWFVTISNVTLLPQARLRIAAVERGSIQISWATNFTEHVLESAPGLPAASWNTVTNDVAVTGNRFAVTVEANAAQRFYRLRKP